MRKKFVDVAPVTCANYPGYLRQMFPQCRNEIDEEVGPAAEGDWLTAQALTRNVLTSAALDQAIESGDQALIARWYSALEELLASQDADLRDAVLHGAPRAALDSAARAVQSQLRAGPLLASAIDERSGDATWRTKTDWVDEPREEAPYIASLVLYLFRNELLVHGRRFDAAAGNYPATRPFARLPMVDRPAEVGPAIAGLLSELAVETCEVRDQMDDFLDFARVEWRPLYTGSLIVTLEINSAAGEVQVWAHEGAQRGDLFVNPPISPPAISNWHWTEDLGSAVLAALHRSSTTGWTGPYPS